MKKLPINHFIIIIFCALLLLFPCVTNSIYSQTIWEPVPFPDTLNSKAINAEKEDFLFVAAGKPNGNVGLFRSTDTGKSWTELPLHQGYIIIYSIRYNPDGVLFIAVNDGIYRSYDEGNNFEKVNNIPVLNINFSPTGEIFGTGWPLIIRSCDGGDNWDTLYYLPGNKYFADIDFGLNGELYAVGGSFDGQNTGSGFHRSLDNGVTWENIGITNQHLNDIEVNSNGDIIVAGEQSAFYTSVVGGTTWSVLWSVSANDLQSDSYNHLFAAVNGYYDKGCFFSENWGSSWTNLTNSILNPYINSISIAPDNTVYAQCPYHSKYQYQIFKSVNPILPVQNHLKNKMFLYPNPTKGKLSLINYLGNNPYKYNIYSQRGQQIISGKSINNSIDVSVLMRGCYIVELKIKNRIIRKKIIVE